MLWWVLNIQNTAHDWIMLNNEFNLPELKPFFVVVVVNSAILKTHWIISAHQFNWLNQL